MDRNDDTTTPSKLKQLADRAADAALSPDADPRLLPQLLGVGVRGQIAVARLEGPSESRAADWQPDPIGGHPDLPDIAAQIPGPPWNPFPDPDDPELLAINDMLIARAVVWHRERATHLRSFLGRDAAELLDQVKADLKAARAPP